MAFAPPRLPNYLANTYDLKPIDGVPTDDDVKTIHATIRAVNSASYIPALDSPNLAIQLAQHLFNTQMAVYRNRYSYSIFPEDVTYAPPTFPPHIPVKLEPVVGPPSDEQLNSVYSAVRALDSLANFAPMFDADLTMKLSQHLFDIQFARYIQQSAQRQSSPRPQQVQAADSWRVVLDGPEVVTSEEEERDQGLGAADQSIEPVRFSVPEQETLGNATRGSQLESSAVGKALEDTNRLLSEMGDVLKHMDRVLVSTQHTVARGHGCGYDLINQKGDLPGKHGLPPVTRNCRLGNNHVYRYYMDGVTDQQLSAYLNFYNLGVDLMVEDDAGNSTIAPDKKREAEILLFKHLEEHPDNFVL